MEKHSESRLSYLFAHLPLLSSDLVSSDSSHLCFSTVHIVGSFTSKLPSNIVGLSRNIVSDKNMGLSQTMGKTNDNIMGISKNIRGF